VSSAPPPMPVRPTSSPTRAPATVRVRSRCTRSAFLGGGATAYRTAIAARHPAIDRRIRSTCSRRTGLKEPVAWVAMPPGCLARSALSTNPVGKPCRIGNGSS
jgi:hypothetical protein